MKLYKQLQIHVDADAIAKGMIGMMNEDELACLSIGMLPGDKMELCRNMVGEKICKERGYTDLGELRFNVKRDTDGQPDFANVDSFTPRDVIDEIVDEISTAIYQAAEMHV